jgi:lipoprotein-anchoring transpeptidase ErfK/SrfK
VPTLAPTAAPTSVPTPAPLPNGLKQGDTGASVKTLQSKINRFKYKIAVNSIFGPETDYAVRDFQRRTGLPVNGIATAETIQKLDSLPARSPYVYSAFDAAADPVAQAYFNQVVNSAGKSSRTSYLIYVNLSKYIVCIYTGSTSQWTLVRSFPCSIGAPETPTIQGTFSIRSKGVTYVTNDNIILKYYAYFVGGFKLHSILYYPSGKVADGRLGLSISHGCVRMAIDNAKYIYDNLAVGTTIWIP